MADKFCSTCATNLSDSRPHSSEKPSADHRSLDCCRRCICGSCLEENPRLRRYCPFCQLTTGPSILPQGLRDPPSYSPAADGANVTQSQAEQFDAPPPYDASNKDGLATEKAESPADDVLHFLDPNADTLASLALRYRVPPAALRRKNGLYADHLLAARKTILVPGEFYKGGVSLSPSPLESEEEEIRKAKVRRWMVACKNPQYHVALLYLDQNAWDLDAAVTAYLEDEQWERANPIAATTNSKTRWKSKGSFGLTSQLR